MAVTLRFSVYGEDQINRTLARFEAADDATPVWEALADDFLKIERRQFASEGAYGSGGWAPLSPRYAKWKAEHYPGRPILERTGDLVASLTEGPQVRIITPGFMVLGSAVDYGEYHQTGTPRMPRRRPIEFTESTRREWVKTMQRYIVTGEVNHRGGATGLRAAGSRST